MTDRRCYQLCTFIALTKETTKHTHGHDKAEGVQLNGDVCRRASSHHKADV